MKYTEQDKMRRAVRIEQKRQRDGWRKRKNPVKVAFHSRHVAGTEARRRAMERADGVEVAAWI